MRNPMKRWWRVSGVVIAMLGLGLVGASPAAAEEICRPNAGLGLVDENGDGVVNRAEVQAFVDALGDSPGAADLRAVVNNWPANLTGIRYTGCTEDSGTGNNGGGTGNNGGGTGNNGGSTGNNNGGGTGNNGGGTGNGDGSGASTGDGSGTENPTTVVMIDGTPVVVDAVTGLPATGQGGASTPGSIDGSSIAFFGLSALGLAAAGTLIGWRRRAS